jgi:uncharacterized membrane protein YecN with MAPEG domain
MLALTGKEIGLGLCGLAFVVFALTTSMVLPRRYPNFPGRRRGMYLFFCFVFFVGMLCAVIFLATEDKEEPAHGGEAAALVQPR